MISLSYLFEQEKRKEMKIGVIGYSAQKFDETLAKKLIQLGLEKAGAKSGDELVSGLTDLGIPGLAYRIGKNQNMKLIGIACKLAKDYECYPVDNEILIGEKWGDESETFLNYIDTLIKVGGGPQSEAEYEKFKGPKFKFELPAVK